MNLERALTKTGLVRGPGPRDSYLAFGETKTLGEWSRDPRCIVPLRVLKTRLNRGVPPERAITGPEVDTTLYEAFGEKKTLRAWADDPRCTVTINGLTKRLKFGWPVEAAVCTPRYKNRVAHVG